MNKIACKDCVFFDAQIKYIQGQARPTQHGYCAATSKYHAQEQPGQVFPADVERVGPDELAQMDVVKPNQVVTSCLRVIKKASP